MLQDEFGAAFIAFSTDSVEPFRKILKYPFQIIGPERILDSLKML
jgi:hypothetical protein